MSTARLFSKDDAELKRPSRVVDPAAADHGTRQVRRKREVTPGNLAGTPNQTPRHCVWPKPSSSLAAELDRDAFRTDPHDMCPM
jgi:hypothetical protein